MKSKCINPNNNIILELAKQLGKSKYETAIDVEIWQENNATSKIPNVNDLNGKVNYQLSSTEGQIASEKTIRDLAARMSDRIGMPIKFESDRSKDYKGKIENNVAYINLAYATLDTPIHEILGHPIIRAIKNKQETSFLGQFKIVPQVQGFPSSTTVLERDDVLVIYGSNNDIYKFMRKYY